MINHEPKKNIIERGEGWLKQGRVRTIVYLLFLPTIATSHFPSWFLSFKNWTTSNAFALSWILEFAPLNWNILLSVSKMNTSSWFSDERAKGTWIAKCKNKHQNFMSLEETQLNTQTPEKENEMPVSFGQLAFLYKHTTVFQIVLLQVS